MSDSEVLPYAPIHRETGKNACHYCDSTKGIEPVIIQGGRRISICKECLYGMKKKAE